MKRFYIFKDGTQVGSAVEREQALHMIRQYQALETHPFLKAEFSIIAGEEEFIPYPPSVKRPGKSKTWSDKGGLILEVKINREIRNYTESMFFGLSMRQCVCSLLAVVVAVGLYFLLKPYVGTETVSWMCVLGAAPFAALGFFTYHGMTAEQFIWAWLRSELLEPRELRFESSTLYYDLLKSSLEKREKEEYKRHD